MKTVVQISRYLESIPEPKRTDMARLHGAILARNPACRLWFHDGKDESGKVVSNPSIGYGTLHRKYADGRTGVLFQAGISANSSGLSVYIMGLEDKRYLPEKYAPLIGKASVTGYCIKFKALKDIDVEVLVEAIQDGIERTRTPSPDGQGTSKGGAPPTLPPVRLFPLEGARRKNSSVEAWLSAPVPETRSLARRWFDEWRACGKDVEELLHDGRPTACVRGVALGYVNAFKAHVNVGFFPGATLPDPDGLLEGSGKFMRHVKVRPAERSGDDKLRALMRAAYADLKARIAESGQCSGN